MADPPSRCNQESENTSETQPIAPVQHDHDPQQQSVAIMATETNNIMSSTTNKLSETEARLDVELQVLAKMKLAFSASIHMLEEVHDTLEDMGRRVDWLCATSKLCRAAIKDKQERGAQANDNET
jgi:hypothetical protein